MFRAKIKLNVDADVGVEATLLRQKAERGRLSDSAVNNLIENFTAAVTPLVESGRLMRSQGSNFNVTRSITGKGYDVKLEFSTVTNQSFVARLKNAIFDR